jgi:hypothetical protein
MKTTIPIASTIVIMSLMIEGSRLLDFVEFGETLRGLRGFAFRPSHLRFR